MIQNRSVPLKLMIFGRKLIKTNNVTDESNNHLQL